MNIASKSMPKSSANLMKDFRDLFFYSTSRHTFNDIFIQYKIKN